MRAANRNSIQQIWSHKKGLHLGLASPGGFNRPLGWVGVRRSGVSLGATIPGGGRLSRLSRLSLGHSEIPRFLPALIFSLQDCPGDNRDIGDKRTFWESSRSQPFEAAHPLRRPQKDLLTYSGTGFEDPRYIRVVLPPPAGITSSPTNWPSLSIRSNNAQAASAVITIRARSTVRAVTKSTVTPGCRSLTQGTGALRH